ncbi:MAG TPA: glycosyltransferase family 2 protein [Vicinamibacterales bacterium]|nr:glycosyltransferase family 2 protein [Vicinamibacterales bacterium]
MRISVVITTYNRAALLAECLASLARQAYAAGDELIVVDNGSTDRTAAVLETAAEAFPVPLRTVVEPTPGKTPALVAGLKQATGDLIALTDDDVVVAADWIGTARRLFEEDPGLALAAGRVEPRWERRPPRWLRFDGPARGRMASPLALLHYSDERQPLGPRTAVGANMIVRRVIMEALGGFAPHLGRLRGTLLSGEDHDFCERLVAAGYRALYCPELIVQHWVPAERLRVSYFLRWFYWSGITHARLARRSGTTDGGGRRAGGSRYWWRTAVTTLPAAAARLAISGSASAVERLTEGAFALGYLHECWRWRRPADRWRLGDRAPVR